MISLMSLYACRTKYALACMYVCIRIISRQSIYIVFSYGILRLTPNGILHHMVYTLALPELSC